jgi:hypothetical protein
MGGKLNLHCASCTYKSNPLFCRTLYAILDNERRIIAILTGHPFSRNGIPDDWDDVVACTCIAIEAACEEMHFEKDDYDHQQGPILLKLLVGPMALGSRFVFISCSVTYS